jgi:prepilin-type N-terminal cleavage/methylation domain-containing protein
MTFSQKPMRGQAGFTLVELAIVMIIIGLLIAGVLKGQALINNARVTSTVAENKAIDAAISTFRDTYAGIPGDLVSPATRLPNCLAAPCVPAIAPNGDGILGNNPSQTPTGSEGGAFFVQLGVANLMTGIIPTAAAAGEVFGANYPAAKISGVGFQASSSTGVIGNFTGIIGATVPNSGLYLTLQTVVGAPSVAATALGLKPDEALRLDTKIDDGAPDTGDVRAFGTAGAAGCGTAGAAGVAGTYATNITSAQCGLYMHTQN